MRHDETPSLVLEKLATRQLCEAFSGTVIPAQAGIQPKQAIRAFLDSRLRENDVSVNWLYNKNVGFTQITWRKCCNKVKVMKGPGQRLNLDVRRVWRCTTCATERHTGGNATFVLCHFCQDHPPMSLIEPERPVRAPAAPLDLVVDLHPDDVGAPAYVPVHLRELEAEPVPEPPAETAVPVESVVESQPTPNDEEPATQAEPSTTDERGSANTTRRKKNRRKRKQRKTSADQPASQNSNRTASPDSATAPTNPARAADDSFGTGLDP